MKLTTKWTALLLTLVIACGMTADVNAERIETAETEITEEDFTPKRGLRTPGGCRPKPEEDPTAETGAGACGWYCAHTTNGQRPNAPGEMSWLTEHGGYFLGADEKVIYLTFDAGYENGNIAKILDTLKAENVPGAFFILKNLAERNPELVQRMAAEGHTICNHTARHKDMTTFTEEAFGAELADMEKICLEATGCEMAHYYRPPEGRLSEENVAWAEKLGYKTILWSYAYADWDNDRQMSPDKALAKVLAGTHNGEVILLHPTSATNAAILGDLIRAWKAEGYRFGTLDELTK